MRISVIIPIYNVSPYIEECIDSVIRQTWNGDIECILIDDCSSDDSFKIAKELTDKYSGNIQFKLIRHTHNKGLSEARNSGLDISTGDYILFLDSDDYLCPGSLELLANEVIKHDHVDIVHGSTLSIPDKAYYHRTGLRDIEFLDSNAEIRERFSDLSINAWDKLISSSFIESHGLRFRPGIIHEDELWSFYLYRSVSTIAFAHETTYMHRIREKSIMTTLNDDIELENWNKILIDVFDSISNPFESNIEIYFLKKFFKFYDKTPIWNNLVYRISELLLKNGRRLDNVLFRKFIETNDEFYRNILIDCHSKGPDYKVFQLVKHQLFNLVMK
ncbi:MAG: glycosyltransferase family 2 protein [Bacteroidales bacterium]|nr:glycosyltransferase family 2 protein [Bacteroidales bacterium]